MALHIAHHMATHIAPPTLAPNCLTWPRPRRLKRLLRTTYAEGGEVYFNCCIIQILLAG